MAPDPVRPQPPLAQPPNSLQGPAAMPLPQPAAVGSEAESSGEPGVPAPPYWDARIEPVPPLARVANGVIVGYVYTPPVCFQSGTVYDSSAALYPFPQSYSTHYTHLPPQITYNPVPQNGAVLAAGGWRHFEHDVRDVRSSAAHPASGSEPAPSIAADTHQGCNGSTPASPPKSAAAGTALATVIHADHARGNRYQQAANMTGGVGPTVAAVGFVHLPRPSSHLPNSTGNVAGLRKTPAEHASAFAAVRTTTPAVAHGATTDAIGQERPSAGITLQHASGDAAPQRSAAAGTGGDGSPKEKKKKKKKKKKTEDTLAANANDALSKKAAGGAKQVAGDTPAKGQLRAAAGVPVAAGSKPKKAMKNAAVDSHPATVRGKLKEPAKRRTTNTIATVKPVSTTKLEQVAAARNSEPVGTSTGAYTAAIAPAPIGAMANAATTTTAVHNLSANLTSAVVGHSSKAIGSELANVRDSPGSGLDSGAYANKPVIPGVKTATSHVLWTGLPAAEPHGPPATPARSRIGNILLPSITTYGSLIALCILCSQEKRLLLSTIYDFVGVHRRLVKAASHDNWKNSIRHNLSLRKCFQKITRAGGDGKVLASWWIVNDVQNLPKLAFEIVQVLLSGDPGTPSGTVELNDPVRNVIADLLRMKRPIDVAPVSAEEEFAKAAAVSAALAGGCAADFIESAAIVKDNKMFLAPPAAVGDGGNEGNGGGDGWASYLGKPGSAVGAMQSSTAALLAAARDMAGEDAAAAVRSRDAAAAAATAAGKLSSTAPSPPTVAPSKISGDGCGVTTAAQRLVVATAANVGQLSSIPSSSSSPVMMVVPCSSDVVENAGNKVVHTLQTKTPNTDPLFAQKIKSLVSMHFADIAATPSKDITTTTSGQHYNAPAVDGAIPSLSTSSQDTQTSTLQPIARGGGTTSRHVAGGPKTPSKQTKAGQFVSRVTLREPALELEVGAPSVNTVSVSETDSHGTPFVSTQGINSSPKNSIIEVGANPNPTKFKPIIRREVPPSPLELLPRRKVATKRHLPSRSSNRKRRAVSRETEEQLSGADGSDRRSESGVDCNLVEGNIFYCASEPIDIS